MEIVDIETLDSNNGGNGLTAGIDFLINPQKMTDNSRNSEVNLEDLDDLENKLNNDQPSRSHSPMGGIFKLGQGGSGGNDDWGTGRGGGGNSLGEDTRKLNSNTSNSTWDGFSKISDANLAKSDSQNRDSSKSGGGMFSWFSGSAGNNSGNAPVRSERDRIRDKKRMLRKLQEWKDKGIIRGDSMYTMETPLDQIEDEYEACLEDKRRKDSIKLQKWWLISAVNTLEYTNSRFDPFDVNLDGFGEQINEDIESYEDVFSELYEKYKGGKLAPEVTLLLKVVFSAVMVNITNKALSSAVPSVNDIIRQSPDLLRAFTNATAESMSRDNSAASGLVNSVMNSNIRPPPAMETQGPRSMPPPPRPGAMGFTPNPGRPDLMEARNQDQNQNARNSSSDRPMFQEKGVDMSRNSSHVEINAPREPPQVRREMTGPVAPNRVMNGAPSIDDILQTYTPMARDGDSSVSIASLKEIQASAKPKPSRKRKSNNSNSDRDENVISLAAETSLSL
jgi:hypothetical protein